MEQIKIDLGNLYDKQRAIRDALRGGIVKRLGFVGSVQVGKSYLGARLLVEQVFTNTNPDTNLLLCISPNYSISRVMVREFEAVLKQDDRLWKAVIVRRSQPYTYTFPNGKIVEFHSAENPNSLRGLRPAFILVDEGAYLSEEAWNVIEGRTTQTAAPIVVTTTPRGKRHWLYRKLFVKGAPPENAHHVPEEYDPDRYMVQVATIYDNPYIQTTEREAMIKAYGGPNTAWARQELFGDFVDYEGLVFTAFNEQTMVRTSDAIPIPETFEYVASGVDFGFTAPSTIITIGLHKGVWYVTDEFYERKVEIDMLGAEMALHRAQWRVMRFWADSAEPARISHYNRSGLAVYPVVKPKVIQKAQYINSLFAQGRLVISSRCANLIRELATLSWPEGRDDDEKNPVGDDHAIDALGYVLWQERLMLASTQPRFVGNDDWGPRLVGPPKVRGPIMTSGYFD